nr:hypothetical protein [Tanacetum cinerariifolium]
MMLDSIDNGPLVYLTVEENGQTRPKKYSELSEAQQLHDDCDVQAINIILHGLPPDVYALVTHQKAAKDIWDNVKLLMKGIKLSYQELECRFYNLFDKFAYVQGETLEWSKFVTDAKLAKSLYTTNCDQLYAYLSQHERHANESPQHSDSGLTVPTFKQGEDPIGRINKPMAFLSAVASRYMAKHYTQPKRPRSSAWFKEKLMLAEAQEAGQILDKEQLAFIADPGITEVQVAQQIIPYNLAFQTEDLDAYDSDCDDTSSAKVVLMTNLSSCDSDVLSKTLILEEESQSKMLEQAFWLKHLNYNPDTSVKSHTPLRIEAPSELPKDTNSFAPNDLLVLSLVEQMTDHAANLDRENQTNKMRIGAGFSGLTTPLFDTMMVQAPADMGDTPVETHQTPTINQPSIFKSQKKQQPRRKQRKEA